MIQPILSQDEVDALLQGITGESQKLEQEDDSSAGGIRDYDLAAQERIVRGRMPTMEVINERFARNIRIGLFNLIRKSPEVAIGGIKVQKYSAFLREIVVPTNFNIVSVKPLRGNGLIVCDPTLVFAVIDSLFGGIGMCQHAFAARDPELVEVLPGTLEIALETFVVMHENLKTVPRFRATFDALVQGLDDWMRLPKQRSPSETQPES